MLFGVGRCTVLSLAASGSLGEAIAKSMVEATPEVGQFLVGVSFGVISVSSRLSSRCSARVFPPRLVGFFYVHIG